MKYNVQVGLIVEAKDESEARNLVKQMTKKNEINRSNFNGGFIDYVLIHSITEE